MPQWLNGLNRKLARWLWWIVLAGVIASLPVMYFKAQTESTADQTALVIDYRDLLQIGSGQADPGAFVAEQLSELAHAGVNGAIVYESTLDELALSQEVAVYSAAEAAALQGRTPTPGDNRTYVVFLNPAHASEIRRLITEGFAAHGASVDDWSVDGHSGVIIDMGKDDAMLRPFEPNPIEIRKLREAGLWVVPRLSDRYSPFPAELLNQWLKSFKAAGIDRISFDGNAVPGFSVPSPGPGRPGGVQQFAFMLNNNGIGIAPFENLRTPVQGLNQLSQYIDYNVIRAHSITDQEMATIKPDALADRILLAVKDRNIRLVFLNAIPSRDAAKGKLSHPIQTIMHALQGKVEDGEQSEADGEGVVQRLARFGHEIGVPQPFAPKHAPAETVLRGLAMLGGIALTAIVIGMFLPSLLALSFAAGAIGGAGLYLLKPTLMVQALALCAAIAAPTAAVILLVRRLRMKRSAGAMSAKRRLGLAALLYVRTALLSLAAVPLVVAMLNHISYSLVLQQFRGVSLLHAAPIALVAIYIYLYRSDASVFANARKLLMTPVTVLWIAAIALFGAAGIYYMSRTGNAGSVTGIELMFRSLLENTFGVRPRTKEFLIGHPLLLAGIFLALRHSMATGLLALATIGQLSIVSTFTHLHTPLVLSAIRVMLGLGLGLLLGLVVIAAWQIAERAWKRLELREAK